MLSIDRGFSEGCGDFALTGANIHAWSRSHPSTSAAAAVSAPSLETPANLPFPSAAS